MPIGKIAKNNKNLRQSREYCRAQGSWERDKKNKKPELVCSNYFSDPMDSKTCAEEVREFSAVNKNVQNLDLRFSISFDPAEHLTQEQEKDFTCRVMMEMGLQEELHQYAVIRHSDKSHPHHHIEITRVGLDGKPIDGSFTMYRLELAIDKVEKEMGLNNSLAKTRRFVYDATSDRGYRMQSKNFQSNKIGVATIREKVPKIQEEKKFLQTLILTAVRDGVITEIEELKNVLAPEGVDLSIRRDSKNKVTGLSFAYQGHHYKGTAIGLKASTLNKIFDEQIEIMKELERKKLAIETLEISKTLRDYYTDPGCLTFSLFCDKLANNGFTYEIFAEGDGVTIKGTEKKYPFNILPIPGSSEERLSKSYIESRITENAEEAVRKRKYRDLLASKVKAALNNPISVDWESFARAISLNSLEVRRSDNEKEIYFGEPNNSTLIYFEDLEKSHDTNEKFSYDDFLGALNKNKAARDAKIEAEQKARAERNIISKNVQSVFNNPDFVDWDSFVILCKGVNLSASFIDNEIQFTNLDTKNNYFLKVLEKFPGSDEKLSNRDYNNSLEKNKAARDAKIEAEQKARVERDIISKNVQAIFNNPEFMGWDSFVILCKGVNLSASFIDGEIQFTNSDTKNNYFLKALEKFPGSDEKLSNRDYNNTLEKNKAARDAKIEAEQKARAERDNISIKLQSVFNNPEFLGWESFAILCKDKGLSAVKEEAKISITLASNGKVYPLETLEKSIDVQETFRESDYEEMLNKNLATARTINDALLDKADEIALLHDPESGKDALLTKLNSVGIRMNDDFSSVINPAGQNIGVGINLTNAFKNIDIAQNIKSLSKDADTVADAVIELSLEALSRALEDFGITLENREGAYVITRGNYTTTPGNKLQKRLLEIKVVNNADYTIQSQSFNSLNELQKLLGSKNIKAKIKEGKIYLESAEIEVPASPSFTLFYSKTREKEKKAFEQLCSTIPEEFYYVANVEELQNEIGSIGLSFQRGKLCRTTGEYFEMPIPENVLTFITEISEKAEAKQKLENLSDIIQKTYKDNSMFQYFKQGLESKGVDIEQYYNTIYFAFNGKSYKLEDVVPHDQQYEMGRFCSNGLSNGMYR